MKPGFRKKLGRYLEGFARIAGARNAYIVEIERRADGAFLGRRIIGAVDVESLTRRFSALLKESGGIDRGESGFLPENPKDASAFVSGFTVLGEGDDRNTWRLLGVDFPPDLWRKAVSGVRFKVRWVAGCLLASVGVFWILFSIRSRTRGRSPRCFWCLEVAAVGVRGSLCDGGGRRRTLLRTPCRGRGRRRRYSLPAMRGPYLERSRHSNISSLDRWPRICPLPRKSNRQSFNGSVERSFHSRQFQCWDGSTRCWRRIAGTTRSARPESGGRILKFGSTPKLESEFGPPGVPSISRSG